MKKTSLFIIYFCVGLLASHFSAMATDTTFRVGVPNPPTNSDPISDESISTTVIDTTLVNLTAQFPAQFQYPANFLEDLSNGAFLELFKLKLDLETEIGTFAQADPKIKEVFSVLASVNPLKVTLTQQGASIGLKVSQMDVNIFAEFETQAGIIGGLFCPTPTGFADIKGLVGTASFDIFTGNISAVTANFSHVEVNNVSCGGLLGFIGDIYLALFPVGIDDIVTNALNDLAGAANMQTFFSIRDELQGILDGNNFTQPHASKALAAMDEIILKTDLNSGLQVDIEIDDSLHNEISFIASQRAPSLFSPEYTLNNVIVDFTVPDNGVVEIYIQLPGNSTWSLAATATQSGVVFGELDDRTKIMAVARSTLIPGLYSFPSNIRITNHVFNGGCPEGDCEQPL